MIRERVRAGLKRAKAQGKRLGRPSIVGSLEGRVRALRRKGKGIIAIAREVGCGVGTVQKIVAS